GDERAAGELGQHPGVDPVGRAGKWCQPLDLARIGDLHLPAPQLELVVDEAGPGSTLLAPRRLPPTRLFFIAFLAGVLCCSGRGGAGSSRAMSDVVRAC